MHMLHVDDGAIKVESWKLNKLELMEDRIPICCQYSRGMLYLIDYRICVH